MTKIRAPRAKTPEPSYRKLRVYSVDPTLALSVETMEVANSCLEIRWSDLQEPGPVGQYIEVIDYDPVQRTYYTPVDLSDPRLLATNGLEPSEADPRFHQQMVYAVCMFTIQSFEAAIGRKVLWSQRRVTQGGKTSYEFVEKLRVYPHGIRAKNAYYDPTRKALLFGSFASTGPGRAPSSGGTVHTSLSFDIIAHEMTHAVLDGLHRRYTENTNPDVLAFHEAFADLVALFQHFSLPVLLRHQVAAARGELDGDTLLSQLAVQFGQGTGHYGALRDAIGKIGEDGVWHRKDPREYDLGKILQPHKRGSVLVSAVFDAFLLIYKKRTADLFRLASGGTGILRPGAIDPDLAGRLCDEASVVAEQVLGMCIRALDYMPPVDPTFDDFLRAVLTADRDSIRSDPLGYRVAFAQAFQKWDIEPRGGLYWERLGGAVDEESLKAVARGWFDGFRKAMQLRMREYAEMPKADERASERKRIHDWSQETAREIHGHLSRFPKLTLEEMGEEVDAIPHIFGIEPTIAGSEAKFEVHSARPFTRVPVLREDKVSELLVIVVTQRVFLDRDSLKEVPPESKNAFVFRGGSTIIYDLTEGDFRYVIRKNIMSEARRRRQREYQQGRGASLYFEETKQPFRLMHETEDTEE